MPFPAGLVAPEGLRAAGLVLRPITAADNRADLEGLERRHAEQRALTYTVLDPAGTSCLGCVYLMPPDARMYDGAQIVPAAAEDRWENVDAAVYFWVRVSHLLAGTDRVLLASVLDWLRGEWGLERAVVVTPEDLAQQVATVESTGLQLRFTITERGKPGRYLAYG